MTKFADLHIHTYFSDGADSPEQIVQQAHDRELACIAIADHDTMDAVPLAVEAGRSLSVEVIPAIEFSTKFNNKDIHILGYFLDSQNSELKTRLAQFQEVRVERIAKMLANLKEQGVDNISLDEVCGLTHSAAVGRPHLALLLKEKGWVSSINQAFEKYIGDGCSAYEAKFEQTPYEAITLIRRAGGAAVMAHPAVTGRDELIPGFVREGLAGIEVYYPNTPDKVVEFYTTIAKKHNLVMTGGSDMHGREDRDFIYVGKKKVPYETVEELRNRAGK